MPNEERWVTIKILTSDDKSDQFNIEMPAIPRPKDLIFVNVEVAESEASQPNNAYSDVDEGRRKLIVDSVNWNLTRYIGGSTDNRFGFVEVVCRDV